MSPKRDADACERSSTLTPEKIHTAGRVVLEHLRPEVDGGRFPVKRTVGEEVEVRVGMFADGHDRLAGVLRHRHMSEEQWSETPLRPEPNDLWTASFEVLRQGRHLYTVEGWVDPFATWSADTRAKADAGQDVSVELLRAAQLLEAAASRARLPDADLLGERARMLRDTDVPATQRLRVALSDEVRGLMEAWPDRSRATAYDRELEVVVDRERARFSSWYEFFPRSCTDDPDRHGTFRDALERLEYVADMGFDVVYLPPIHPIGQSYRKGRNNARDATPEDVGSPWAIGGAAGGHTAVHPDLGTLDDFDALQSRAHELGMELALDLAYQCSPDHPWVEEHPEWFLQRPDGSIQYAENPPKKYEDIYPIHFDAEHREELWEGLAEVVRFWVDRGVRIFRVDNPHTKAFPFWEWLIRDIKRRHPDVLFLSEAFTRPRKMHRLAKLGFTQSYTYFTWRNTKADLSDYLTELFSEDGREYLRANLWPNTPDILPEFLQTGGRAAFMARATLAATAGASWGVYGPAFELCEAEPREPGGEEYADSEKYQIRVWDLDDPMSLRPYLRRLNEIRAENPALHDDRNLRLVDVDNEKLIAYMKASDEAANVLLVVVNLDPHHVHSGWVDVPLQELGLEDERSYQMHDLLSDARYLWYGRRNFVKVDPSVAPAHVFRMRRRIRTERDFDYYM